MDIVKHISDVAQGKTTITRPRSPEWPRVEKEHLAKQPRCAVCEGRKKLQVHHIKPYHIHPELELDPNNLITLCEAGTSCHLVFGHLGDFHSFNVTVVIDAAAWNMRFHDRPKGDEAQAA